MRLRDQNEKDGQFDDDDLHIQLRAGIYWIDCLDFSKAFWSHFDTRNIMCNDGWVELLWLLLECNFACLSSGLKTLRCFIYVSKLSKALVPLLNYSQGFLMHFLVCLNVKFYCYTWGCYWLFFSLLKSFLKVLKCLFKPHFKHFYKFYSEHL